ncbi:MAG: hypothetical protein ACYS8Z_16530, partial [Planctomycetota bacterium]
MTRRCLVILGTWLVLLFASAAIGAERRIPLPSAGHPGNVYLAGEVVGVLVPGDLAGSAVRWRMLDDGGKVVTKGEFEKDEG